MKVLACSDFQLGAGADYGSAPGSRLADQEYALNHIVEAAQEHNVDAVIFAGDAFQHRRPSVDELLVFRRWLDTLYGKQIPVFAIPGNHDVRGPGRASSLALFTDRLSLFELPGATRLPGKAGLAFLPWAHPATWRLQREWDERQLADLPSYAAALVEVAGGLKADLDPAAPSILVAHWAISDTALPSGMPVSMLREPLLHLDDLLAQGWDCVIAGHIHRSQVAARVVVPGSPAVCDFGESEHPHGCFVLTVGNGDFEGEFVDIPGRPFVTVEHEYGESLASIEEDLEGAVVRLRLQAVVGDDPDLGSIRKYLYARGASKVWSIEVQRERAARAGSEGLADDEGPLELFDRWIAARWADDPDAERLREELRAYLEETR